ncbi:hypothetical protein WJX72_007802 [[Myrmecia] bisecta]|uniref:SANT domain-containing protein n=1 Tax=[Myrmecia] bisecta TaxID=41462 RepID=A0AAW1Q9J6_9CHLO
MAMKGGTAVFAECLKPLEWVLRQRLRVQAAGGTALRSAHAASQQAPGRPHSGMSLVAPVPSAQAPPPVVVVSDVWLWGFAGYSLHPQYHQVSTNMPAVLAWLREAARTEGRMPPPLAAYCQAALRTSVTSPAEQETRIKGTLDRLRQVTHQGVADLEPAGVRRSSRARAAPDLYKPTFEHGFRLNVRSRQHMSAEEQSEMNEGEEWQAVLPEVRKRPARMTPEEAQWLSPPILERGSCGPPSRPAPVPLFAKVLASPARASSRHQTARHGLPSPLSEALVTALGLRHMGAADAGDWSEAEVAAFDAGMRAHERDFDAIHKEMLPSKPIARLVDFYYNVWKTKAVVQAQQWYQRRAEEEAAAARQAAAAAVAKLAAEERRLEAIEQGVKTRQLRDMLAWLRQTARMPADANMQRRPLRERAVRSTQVLAMANLGWREQPPVPPLAADAA